MTYIVSREHQGQRCQSSRQNPLHTLLCEQPSEAEAELEELAVRVEFDEPLDTLLRSVHAAAGELEGQGAKSDRISRQLYSALATFHQKTGRP